MTPSGLHPPSRVVIAFFILLIDVIGGRKVENIDVALRRGAAIAGTVSDEFGEPIVGAVVRALRTDFRSGSRELTSAGYSSQTNDLGEFRVFGLAPGPYFVSAEIRAALESIDSVRAGYPPTYFPGTVSLSRARPVFVSYGETISNVLIPLRSVEAVRVSGVVLDLEGRPFSGGFINVTAQAAGAGLAVAAGQIKQDGTFTVSGVTPGDYILRGDTTGRGADGRPQIAVGRITVLGGSDIAGIRIQVQPWATLRGRIAFDGQEVSRDASSMTMRVERLSADDPFDGIWSDGTVNRDGSFQIHTPVWSCSRPPVRSGRTSRAVSGSKRRRRCNRPRHSPGGGCDCRGCRSRGD